MSMAGEVDYWETSAAVDVGDPDWLAAVVASGPPGGEAAAATSWQPVDVAAVLASDYTRPAPTVGRRDDGQALLYRGRTHSLAGEAEAGKSWVALTIAAQTLEAGGGVVYVDFEDDAAAVVDRLLFLGAARQDITARFAYIAPDAPVTEHGGTAALLAAARDVDAVLAVLDGVTEALSMHGLSSMDNDDVARFGRLVTKPLAATGAAVVQLDHVTKASESRGRYALGAAHKLNAVSGAALIVENAQRLGVGLAGRSRIFIAKDRPGALRSAALPSTGDRWWLADFTLDSTRAMPDPAAIVSPVERTTGNFRPTAVMAKVSAAVAGAPHPLSGADIAARVTGKAVVIRTATAVLVDEGYLIVQVGPRGARLHTSARPYELDPA